MADRHEGAAPAGHARDLIAFEHDILAADVGPRHTHLIAEVIASQARMVEVEKPLRADELAVRHLDILRHAQREGEGLIGGGRHPPPVKQPLRIAGRFRRRPARPRHVVNTHVAQEDVPRVAHGPHEWFQLCDGRSRAIQRAQQ